MVTLATGPTGLSTASRIGNAIGTGFGAGFVPGFQKTTSQLEAQQKFNPIMEALRTQIQGGVTSPGQQLIEQITRDPSVFAQVMENPQMAQTILSLNQAAVPVTGRALTGFDELDEINRTFDEAQKALERGETRRAEILFARVGDMAGIEGKVDPKLDLVHLVRAGTNVTIPVQLRDTGGLQTLDGKEITLQEGDRLLESQSISGGLEGVLGTTEQRNLNNAQVSTRNFIDTAGDALRLLEEEPGVNTLTGRAAALFGDLQAEAKTFANALGMTFETAQLNPETYNELFQGLGISNARMRSLITSMAFQAAAAAGSRGQSVSNRDIERFITQVGGDAANPVAFAAVLRDEAERTARNFRNNFFVRTQREFEGDLGLSGLPSGVPGAEELGDVGNMTTEELLRRLGL